jgi:hypothetical protein
VSYTAFASRKGQAVTARLVVRRVRDRNRQAAAGQGELFPVWRCHAVFTGSPFTLLQAEARHRGHAQVEQVLADWTDGPPAHLPPGSFPASAAWLMLAAIARNLLRRRIPGRPRLRQGQRRHHPPRPDRRRRPRADHAAPARGLAPRTGMAEPVRRRPLPAARSGLTSPDPVTAPAPPSRPADPATGREPRTSRRNSERPDSHALIAGNNAKRHQQPNAISAGGLRIRGSYCLVLLASAAELSRF